jgi:hypothetical protein
VKTVWEFSVIICVFVHSAFIAALEYKIFLHKKYCHALLLNYACVHLKKKFKKTFLLFYMPVCIELFIIILLSACCK